MGKSERCLEGIGNVLETTGSELRGWEFSRPILRSVDYAAEWITLPFAETSNIGVEG